VAAKHGREHKGGAAAAVAQVGVGPAFDEQPGNVGVAFEADAHQGGIAAGVAVVGVGALVEQEAGGFEMVVVAGQYESVEPLVVGRVDGHAGGQGGLQSSYFAAAGGIKQLVGGMGGGRIHE
jgi:hypothetical protein